MSMHTRMPEKSQIIMFKLKLMEAFTEAVVAIKVCWTIVQSCHEESVSIT